MPEPRDSTATRLRDLSTQGTAPAHRFPNLDALADIHGLLASPTRLSFIAALASGPKSGIELAEAAGISRSAASQHVQKLKDGGLVGSVRDETVRQIRNVSLVEPLHPVVSATIALLKGDA